MSPKALRTGLLGISLAALLSVGGTGAAPTSADANRRDPDGSTPLQHAVYDGNKPEVERLLAKYDIRSMITCRSLS